jgi:hypothetical protein
MHALKSIILLAAALGAATAKKHKGKRQCAPSQAPTTEPSEPTPTSTDAPSEPTETAPPAGGGNHLGEYSQTHDWRGDKWFSEWNHWGYPDPTHGRVEYVNVDTARSMNLSYTNGDTFFMRTDASSVLDGGSAGRKAVRIETNEAFSYYTMVVDVKHMPVGMGTWPALWSCGDNWPAGGELDIIEAVNNGDRNLMSLHTGEGCTQPESRDMKGSAAYHDCNAYGERGNQGCGVVSDSPSSIGPNFNQAGGGWYAVQRTESFIKVWQWNRDDSSVPDDVKKSLGSVSPSEWGKPTAHFVSDSCNLAEKFGPNKFIINLTYCGDWAGNAFDMGDGNRGMDACNRYVEANPQAFQDAYWEIARMNVYQKQ